MRAALVDVLPSLVIATTVFLMVVFADGPKWAGIGFGLVAYWVTLPRRNR